MAPIRVSAAGGTVRLSQAAVHVLGGADPESIDGHSIQPYYATLLAKDCGLTIEAVVAPSAVTLTARRAG